MEDRIFYLGQFLVELSLVEYRMLKHHPSMLASAALYMSMKILKKEQFKWSEKLKESTCFSESQIRH